MKLNILLFTILLLAFYTSHSQVITSEDSLYAGLVAGNNKTIFSGYGELRASADLKQKTAEATLRRTVLFVGHKFTNRITLFTEMELENAVVSGNSGLNLSISEIAMEQAFIKFDLSNTTYLTAGLFIPRVGILNENHLPTTFNGTDRPFVEQIIIPATWRSLGIGIYGQISTIPGLYYSASITNGLNSAGFKNGSGIREGRQSANSVGMGLGVNGSLLYYFDDFRFQVSTYVGGSTAMEKRVADSLQLNAGAFGNPVFLNEANLQYRNNRTEFKVLATHIAIPNASEINKAFANNTPSQLWGAYAEVSHNILNLTKENQMHRSLAVFGRAEYLNLNSSIPANGISNDANRQLYLLGGLTYKPLSGVSIKADYTQRITGEQNPALIVTPFPQLVPYYTSKGFINIGLAYNF